MRGRPYASSLSLSQRTRDCYVLFQAGPGIKKCPPQAQNKRGKKKPCRDKFLFDLFEARLLYSGAGISKQGAFLRGKGSRTLDWLSPGPELRGLGLIIRYHIISNLRTSWIKLGKGLPPAARGQDRDHLSADVLSCL